MRAMFFALMLVAALAAPAAAACTFQTYTINGRFITCTTCCTGQFCNTVCN